MATRLERRLNEIYGTPLSGPQLEIDWAKSFMVGDLNETDVEFARKLGIRSFKAMEFYQWAKKGLDKKDPTFSDLAEFSKAYHSARSESLDSYSFRDQDVRCCGLFRMK